LRKRCLQRCPRKLALLNKKVSWTVVANNEELFKGKGTTDDNGVFKAEFSGAPAALKGASLVAVIDMGNRKTVSPAPLL
jgi:hypothetical protein